MGFSMSKVETKTIVIDVTSSRKTAQHSPAPNNFYDTSQGAPWKRAFSSLRSGDIGNTLAAALATDEDKRNDELQDFSKIFLKYHNACVQVISHTDTATSNGSGILFNFTEDRLILVTAFHVIQSLNPLHIKIVLETDYKHVDPNKVLVQAKKTKIVLCNPEIRKNDDVAVLFLKECDSKAVLEKVNNFPGISLTFADYVNETCMIIHYASDTECGKTNKKVATGDSEGQVENYMSLVTPKFHIDAGPGASGAPLFNSKGDVLSILRSRQQNHEVIRTFSPIGTIVHDVIEGKICETNSGQFGTENIFEIYEGKKAFETLREGVTEWLQLPPEPQRRILKDLNSRKAKRNVTDLLRILKRHSLLHIIHVATFTSLGNGGAHQNTKDWSLTGFVESDHFPPYKAYKQAVQNWQEPEGNSNCPEAVITVLLGNNVNSARPGENSLPAITIPRAIHRKLATTGSSWESIAFRSAQTDEIASGNIASAISANFLNYSFKGLFKRANYVCGDEVFDLLLDKYFEGFQDALRQHEHLHFIDESEREELVYLIEDLKKNNDTGEDLDESDRIIIYKVSTLTTQGC